MLHKCNKWHELELFIESALHKWHDGNDGTIAIQSNKGGSLRIRNKEKKKENENENDFPFGWISQLVDSKVNLLYLLSKTKKKLLKYKEAQKLSLQALQENPHFHEIFTLLCDDSEAILRPSDRLKENDKGKEENNEKCKENEDKDNIMTSIIPTLIKSHYHNDREIYNLFENGAYGQALEMTTFKLNNDKSLFSRRNFIILYSSLLSIEREISRLESLKNQLLILYPEDARTFYTSGLLLQLNGEITRAQDEFYMACEKDDQCCAYWMTLGHAYAQTGEHYESISAYNNATKMAPFSIWPVLARVSEYTRTRQIKLARECLLESFEWSKDHPATLNELSILYYQNEELEKALNVLEKALSQVSEHDIVLQMALRCNYATILLKLNKKKKISLLILKNLANMLNIPNNSSDSSFSHTIIPEYYLLASFTRELIFIMEQQQVINDELNDYYILESKNILDILLKRYPDNVIAKKSLQRVELRFQSLDLQSSPEIISKNGREKRSLRRAMTRLSFIKE